MDYLRVGLIVRPHGVRGAVKLQPLSENLSRYRGMKSAFIEREGRYEAVQLRDVSVQPDAVYMTIDGIDTREKAETLRNAYIVVDRKNAAALPKGRYYVDDIIGCQVLDENGSVLGEIAEVYDTPANDVYEVRGEKSFTVPAVKKLILDVDIENKRVVFSSAALMEVGLFED